MGLRSGDCGGLQVLVTQPLLGGVGSVLGVIVMHENSTIISKEVAILGNIVF